MSTNSADSIPSRIRFDEILGRPYAWASSPPESFNCLTFVAYVLRKYYALDLETPDFSPVAIVRFRRQFRSIDWRYVRSGDVLYGSTGSFVEHLAVVESRQYAVSCRWPTGVERQRMAEFDQDVWTPYRAKAWL